ncbi:hypothetical protein Mgra_00009564 [Meloidogyne graminicola]|uniref:Uncharacterized protein n=1 Tax=Meloidogyne graminicola TaxID=189291 RepID=A0A8S9Z927_9BILA|nr:hypothetical protein Mgra_00009564 [Meloidogyne graminicola]
MEKIYLERKFSGKKYQIDKNMVKLNKQLKKIEKQRETPAHWSYYFHCVYPGYQNAYYPETLNANSKYSQMDVTLDTWKIMAPGQVHKTNSLPYFRWYYPYDGWLHYQ